MKNAKKDYNYLCGLDDSDHPVSDEGDKASTTSSSASSDAKNNEITFSIPFFGDVGMKNIMVGLLYFCNQRPGIFVAPYLLLEGFSESKIGYVLFVSGIIALTLQTPAGQIIDEIHHKTRVLILGNMTTIGGCLLLTNIQHIGVVTIAVTINVVSDVFVFPTLYATTLGIFGSDGIEQQAPLNETGTHSGNATFAVFAALIVLFVAGKASSIFYICVAMRCVGIFIILKFINSYDIDFKKSRGLTEVNPSHSSDMESSTHSKDTLASICLIVPEEPLSYTALLLDFHVVVFLASVMMFHFANAAMLPLLSQVLFIANSDKGFAFAAAAVVTAQLAMVVAATVTGKFVPKIGTKPLFILALIAIPTRGVMIVLLLQLEHRGALTNILLLSTQILDGLAGGIIGVLLVLITENLSRGSGRFAMLLGMAKTAEGIGASFSNLTGEVLAEYLGYSGAFLFLSSVSLFPIALYGLCMPSAVVNDDAKRVHDNLSVASRHGTNTNTVSGSNSTHSVSFVELHLNKATIPSVVAKDQNN